MVDVSYYLTGASGAVVENAHKHIQRNVVQSDHRHLLIASILIEVITEHRFEIVSTRTAARLVAHEPSEAVSMIKSSL